jgi:hypothetical protein
VGGVSFPLLSLLLSMCERLCQNDNTVVIDQAADADYETIPSWEVKARRAIGGV